MKITRWWTKTRGLPQEVYESWASALRAQPGRQVRVLAWAKTLDGYCVGSPSALSFGDGTGWSHIGWHQIETGGWDADTGRLSWSLYGGDRDFMELSEVGRLPELFRERVSASIVLEKFIPIHNRRGVLISGRRDLADPDAPITWHSTLRGGLTWETEGVKAATDRAIVQVRTEYGGG